MRLTLRVQKLCFASASATCLCGAVALVIWGAQPEVPFAAGVANTVVKNSLKAIAAVDAERREPAREDFAKLCDRPLRRALYDPPPPKPEVKQLPPLRVEVLGTIIEGENSMAMVRSEQGSVEYKRVGDRIGPADSPANVVEIGPEAMIVKRGEERITLAVRAKERR